MVSTVPPDSLQAVQARLPRLLYALGAASSGGAGRGGSVLYAFCVSQCVTRR